MPLPPILSDARYPLTTSVPATPGQSDFLRWMKNWISDGTIKDDLDALAVTQRAAGANLSVDVAAGRGIDRAVFYEWGTVNNVVFAANASGQDRIDLLVVRLNATTSTVYLEVLTGTPAPTPAYPDPTRTFDANGVPVIYDIVLAAVQVRNGAVSIVTSDITDLRQYLTGAGYTLWGTIASIATFDPPQGAMLEILISGTTPITSIPVRKAGVSLVLRFVSAGCTVTHTGSNIILDGGRNYVSAAGGVLHLMSSATGWAEVSRSKETGAQGLVLAAPNSGSGEVNLIALGTNHLPTGIPNANLGTDTQGRVNHLVNGSFELWQRGTIGFTVSGAYSADRWLPIMGASSTFSLSRDAANIDRPSVYAAAIIYTHVSVSQIKQFMEDWKQFIGQTVTFTMRVKASVANAVRLSITEGGSGATGAFHTGSGAYETLSVTHVVTGSATEVTAIIDLRASGTFVFDRGTLVIGPVGMLGIPQQPAALQDECQRYYEIVGEDNTGSVIVSGQATGSGVTQYAMVRWHTRKAALPTITKNGTWTLQNAAGQPTIDGASKDGCRLLVTSSAVTGTFFAHNGAAGATITAETAP